MLHFRQLSPAKRPEPEIVRPRLKEPENEDVNKNAETKENENIQETSKPDEITHHVITETKPKKKKRRKKPRFSFVSSFIFYFNSIIIKFRNL